MEERLRRKSTPLVRKMVAEHNLDLTAIPGSGLAGRVTRNDVLDYLEKGVPAEPAASPGATGLAGAVMAPVEGVRLLPGPVVEPWVADPEAHRGPHDHVTPGLGPRAQHDRG
jgi:pyruvate/2-oxoglutarate dehydrogenase complex dihydrolipoamide acyltransferase (E2) component